MTLYYITHAPVFRGGAAYVYESPLGNSSLVINIQNPLMHCVASQYDVIMLNNRISVATITYATASPCRVPLNDIFHQNSATQRSRLRIWKISKSVVSNLLGKGYTIPFGQDIYVIKARTSRGVRDDNETHSTCVTGLLSRLRQSHNPVTQSRAFQCHVAHTHACVLAILTCLCSIQHCYTSVCLWKLCNPLALPFWRFFWYMWIPRYIVICVVILNGYW